MCHFQTTLTVFSKVRGHIHGFDYVRDTQGPVVHPEKFLISTSFWFLFSVVYILRPVMNQTFLIHYYSPVITYVNQIVFRFRFRGIAGRFLTLFFVCLFSTIKSKIIMGCNYGIVEHIKTTSSFTTIP